ncbi:MAG: type II toxin-antitoxin system Phd/YefM family antitoxin [Pseudonocardia sp.]|nr:type II toxin-antitoxin system Phd/YefM family antitoxin [Pseudonocardia sp.]
MQDQFNIYEAKTQLSKLVERVENGDEIVLARNGKPVAKIVPLRRRTEPRQPGGWEGKGWMADDFDAPDGEWDEAIDEMYRNWGIDPEKAGPRRAVVDGK